MNSEIEQLKEKMGMQRARLIKFMVALPVGMMVLNHDGIIESVTKSIAETSGYKSDELFGKDATVLLNFTRSGSTFVDYLATSCLGKICEAELKTKEGGFVRVEFTTSLLEDKAMGNRFILAVMDPSLPRVSL